VAKLTVELLVKYCPNCGKAGIEGMKFCPQCGQRLTHFNSEEKRECPSKSEPPLRKKNWFEEHLNWTLLLGIIGGPFVLFWIAYGIVNLIALFSPYVAAFVFQIFVPTMPIMFIVIVVLMVRWYRERKRQSKTMTNSGTVDHIVPR
jgi:ribosomal protein L33